MALIKHKQLVTGDSWTLVSDDQPIPDQGDVIVGLTRFAEAASAQRVGRVGLRVDPEDDLSNVSPVLTKTDMVAINFPKFGDGRGYTKARLIRERFGYKGELRAVGEVLGDQLAYMHRCGFDAFELSAGKGVNLAIRCFEDFTVTYQAATDDPRPLYRRASRGQKAG